MTQRELVLVTTSGAREADDKLLMIERERGRYIGIYTRGT